MKLRNAVVVLGAGASKGAKVIGGKTPPLDSDFLGEAANYFHRKKAKGPNRAQVVAWRDFRKHLKSAGLKFEDVKLWRLEQLSTT